LTTIKFNVQTRFLNFINQIQSPQFSISKIFIYSSGWILFFYGSLYSIQSRTFILLTLVFCCVYCLIKLLDEINKKIRIPTELIIICFFILFSLEKLWLKWFFSTDPLATITIQSPGIIPTVIQILLLNLLIFSFSLILVDKNKSGIGTILFLLFAGIIGLFIAQLSNTYFWWAFLFILVIYLFKKTTWVEELTQTECWIYVAIFILIFRSFNNFSIDYIASQHKNIFWHQIPFIISQFFKFYLLAVLIKIPLVLVFHHARLSRKLKIASLFQSSFPLLIQSIMLLSIFYFFVAGWQAENISRSLEKQFDKHIHAQGEPDNNFITVQLNSFKPNIQIPGLHSFNIPVNPPKSGIIKIEQPAKSAFFIFYREQTDSTNIIYLMGINQDLLTEMGTDLQLLAGTHLTAYPFKFSQRDSLFLKIKGWYRQSNLPSFQILPFGLLPSNSTEKISQKFPFLDKGNSDSKSNLLIFGRKAFTVGRIFSPMYDENFQKIGYWAFDIEFLVGSALSNSGLIGNILFWLVAYFIINFFVIQQVIKLGNLINQTIVNRFNQLKIGIRQISEGNLSYKINLEGEDEFVELANRFNLMGEQLQKTIEEAKEKDRLQYELKIAQNVQLSLLPHTLPHIQGFEISAAMRAAKEVGGDFYDVFPINPDCHLFIIGDVSGKGTSAAFYMAQCMSLVRFSSQFVNDPKEIAIKLNKYFVTHTQERQIFVSAIIGIINTRKHQIEIIRAGHTQPLFFNKSTKNDIETIKIPGIGIGLDRDEKIFNKTMKKHHLKLALNDTVVLYTDGVVEAAKFYQTRATPLESLNLYGEDRLKKIIQLNRGNSAKQILDAVINDLDVFYESDLKIDDFTLLVIQRTG
jgi:serine phosphatase RsbU (regulator of sigma subunit)